MNATQFKEFTAAKQREFFAKFPNPKCKERNIWRCALRHATNGLEGERSAIYNDVNEDFLGKEAERIKSLLSAK